MTSDGASPGLGARYAKDPDFVFRRIADEIILVPVRRNMGDLESIYSLNETAARVWELLDGRRTLGDLVATLVQEFEVAPGTAETDLRSLLGQLTEAGAIHPGPA
jgi:hypothetical protein